MTKKRFKPIIDDMERYYYWKDGTWELVSDESTTNNFYTLEQCANELNRLNKENEQLKSDLDYFKAKNGSLETGMFNLERENEQLKQQFEELKFDLKMAKIDGAIDRMAQRPIRW